MSVALVFPGQGAQYVGMGIDLAQRFPEARAVLDEADRVLGFALSDIIAHGPSDDLTRTDISQPAIFVTSWMSLQVLRGAAPNLNPAATAGLSLGEYTALAAAGALDFADALRLVRLRGQAMQAAADASPGGMVALIGADEAQAAALCSAVAEGEVLQVANLNAPGQVVIAGSSAACQRAIAAAKDHGIRRAMPLPVAGAFHSPLMAPAAERLAQALADTTIAAPAFPVYANVSASPVTAASAIAPALISQLCSPVRWADSVRAMQAAGITAMIELGPGKTLCGMICRTVEGMTCANLDKPEDLAAVLSAAD